MDTGRLIQFLEAWEYTSSWSSSNDFPARMVQLTSDMAKAGFWGTGEVARTKAWIKDLERIGYKFPKIKEFPKEVF
eukprot:TRINITY_DN13014_c0_g1_i1.p2 TRINITY_DN13014_c0_g1~~TRINITY_DN13014_c0_g1_i1.p2  ORF type:complete len:76 (+),score=9.20 TRINITY_DN13014_c0_g1_i1:388-615(+)